LKKTKKKKKIVNKQMDYDSVCTYDQFYQMSFEDQQKVLGWKLAPILDEKTNGYYMVVDRIRFNMYRDSEDDINSPAFRLPETFQ
jgi:hypothetical protein